MIERQSMIPRHIAIIMDGNGRWAQSRYMPRLAGHAEGMNRVIDIVRHSSNLGIDVLTLYAFSTENWKRPQDEVNGLMKLLIQYVEKQLQTLIEENVCVRILGDVNALPLAVQNAIEHAVDNTRLLTGMTLNLALNYGGRAEIVRAAADLARKGESINEASISAALYTGMQPDPDLIIRTGGESRLSNFLLYQAAYAELYFTDTLWPDFREKDLDTAIADYLKRNRRFGDAK